MNNHWSRFIGRIVVAVGFCVLQNTPLGADDDLPSKAISILQSRCSRCHGGVAKQAGLDVLSRENLLESRGAAGSEFSFIVPSTALSHDSRHSYASERIGTTIGLRHRNQF